MTIAVLVVLLYRRTATFNSSPPEQSPTVGTRNLYSTTSPRLEVPSVYCVTKKALHI